MNVKQLSTAVIRALGAGAMVVTFAPVAMAQQQPPQPAAKERIEVTGSNIKRVEGESALPVTVITREEIDRSGATNAMELLQLIGSNASAGSVLASSTIGATTFSAQTANLRGLTGGRTLVLINGKRVNGFSGEVNGVQGVNLTVIPFAAIERVEIRIRNDNFPLVPLIAHFHLRPQRSRETRLEVPGARALRSSFRRADVGAARKDPGDLGQDTAPVGRVEVVRTNHKETSWRFWNGSPPSCGPT